MLDVLPLQLQQGLAGTAEARTWLLPALRRHVSAAPLAFWQGELLPVARQMGAAAAAASSGGRKGMAAACHALELQLWGCLSAFASWPTDAGQVLPGACCLSAGSGLCSGQQPACMQGPCGSWPHGCSRCVDKLKLC